MDPTIADLTSKYCDAYKQTFHLADAWWKYGLPFLSPHPRQQMHRTNLKHGLAPKNTSTYTPVIYPTHRYLHPHQLKQKHQHPFPDNPHITYLEPRPSINYIGITPEVPSTPYQQDNLQELLALL